MLFAFLGLQLGVGCDGDAGPESSVSPPESVATEVDDEALQRLQQIGYFGAGAKEDRAGVTVLDPERTTPGLNLYTSGHGPEAVLIDREGNEWHRWRCEATEAFPDLDGGMPPGYDSLRRARLLPDGELLAIFEGVGLVKLDRDSRLIWARHNGAHHDLEVQANGDILVLTRTAHVVERVHPDRPILEDFVALLDSEGNERRRVSILECIEQAGHRVRFTGDGFHEDPFHTNTVRRLDGTGADRHPALRAGLVLISIRNMDRIAMLDLERRTVVHSIQGGFRRQHDPSVLPDGNLLVFDNLGAGDRSRVLELDITTGRPVWKYRGTSGRPFFSELCGTAQRLPTGHTLITESGSGRAFEITAGGEIVWEFYNPHRFGEQGEFIAELFEVLRLGPSFPVDWSERARAGR